MLIHGDPAALLAFAAGRTRALAAIHELRNPACQLQSSRARVFVDQQAVRQAPGLECGCHRFTGGAKPFGERVVTHVAGFPGFAGASFNASSSAASAAWHTCSRSGVASTTRKRA